MPEHASACPLARLCAEAEELASRKARIMDEELESDSERVRRRAGRVMDEIDVTLSHIARRASDHVPRSREGALFALVVAAGEVETLEASDEEPTRARMRRVRRLLRGVRAWLETTPDLGPLARPLPPSVAEHWMPDHRDPRAGLAG